MAQSYSSLLQCVCCLLLLAGGCAGRELHQQDNRGPGVIRSSAKSSMCLTPSINDKGVILTECAADNRNQQWEHASDNKLRSVGAGLCLAFGETSDACVDLAPECAAWASKGECQANPDYMVGVGATGGQCRASCKVCLPNTCVDLMPECPGWASKGDCQANPKYMLGSGSQAGRCRASCTDCTTRASVSASCVDLAPECAAWAARGECQANPNYMVGTGAKGGQCRASCKVCKPSAIVAPLTLVDCKKASSYQWFWSSESYLRPASQPRLCVAPPPSDGSLAALSACPAPDTIDGKLLWRLE